MKKAWLLLICSLCSLPAFCQRDVDQHTEWSIRDRAYFGLGFGGIGFGQHSTFGTYYSIGLTPMVGYMLAKDLSSGLAFEYQYQGFPDFKTSVTRYGFYPYLRYNIRNFFLQADYDWYNIDDIYTSVEDRDFYNRFLMGVGYFSQGRGRSAVNFLVSYDFIYSNPSQFNSPISIRIFMTF